MLLGCYKENFPSFFRFSSFSQNVDRPSIKSIKISTWVQWYLSFKSRCILSKHSYNSDDNCDKKQPNEEPVKNIRR